MSIGNIAQTFNRKIVQKCLNFQDRLVAAANQTLKRGVDYPSFFLSEYPPAVSVEFFHINKGLKFTVADFPITFNGISFIHKLKIRSTSADKSFGKNEPIIRKRRVSNLLNLDGRPANGASYDIFVRHFHFLLLEFIHGGQASALRTADPVLDTESHIQKRSGRIYKCER